MAIKEEKTPRKLFDVTCVIGSVFEDEFGDGTDPRVVAMHLIAEHNSDGAFTFPTEDGGHVSVIVQTHRI